MPVCRVLCTASMPSKFRTILDAANKSRQVEVSEFLPALQSAQWAGQAWPQTA